MRKVIFIYCLIVFFSINSIYGQSDFIVREFPHKIDFREDYVRKFYSDTSGMLWMRTFSRIFRFNGEQIESFDEIIQPDFRLKDAFILGRKILLNYGDEELRLFDIAELKQTNVAIPQATLPVNCVNLIGQNQIFLASKKQQRIFQCALVKNNLEIRKSFDGIRADKVIPISDTQLVYTNDHSVYLLNTRTLLKTKILDGFNLEDLAVHDSCISLISILEYVCFDFKNRMIIDKFLTPKGEDAHHIRLCNNKLWLFTNNSTYIKNPFNHKFEKLTYSLSGLSISASNQTFDIFYNKLSDNYLLSNYFGLFRLIQCNTFSIKHFDLSNKINDREVSLRCIYSDIESGLIHFSNDGDGKFTCKLGDKLNLKIERYPNSLFEDAQSSNLNKIFEDNQHRLWLGSNSGISIFGNRTIPIPFSGRVWDIAYIKNCFWVVCNTDKSSFLLLFNKQAELKRTFEFVSSKGQANCFWDIEPYGNYLLISSLEGLVVFDVSRQMFIPKEDVFNSFAVLNGRAWSSKVVGNSLFIAFQDKGLRKVNLLTGEVTSPIPSIQKAFQVESSDGKNLWINSQDRITYLRQDGASFSFKTSSFALPIEASFHGMFADEVGSLFIAGKGGFSEIMTNELITKINNLAPKTIFCELTVNEKKKSGLIFSNSELILPHDSNNLRFTLANTILDDANDIKLKYKLVGYDADFVLVEKTNEIIYKNLPHGNYTLEVYLCNSLGIWDPEPVRVFINILPPWYLTLWAKTIYAFLAIGLIYLSYLLLKLRFEKQKKQEFMILESELKAIKSQLNPHFIFNSLNSIQSHIIQNKSETAAHYLNKFAKLLRRVLEYSTVETITLQQEIEWVGDYLELEELRFENKFHWKISVSPKLDTSIQIPALVLQPLIENALIHGLFPKSESGNLHISYTIVESIAALDCTVSDDGKGRKASSSIVNPFLKANISKGMLLTGQRLDYLSKKYKVETFLNYIDKHNDAGDPTGTTVEIRIPIAKISNVFFD